MDEELQNKLLLALAITIEDEYGDYDAWYDISGSEVFTEVEFAEIQPLLEAAYEDYCMQVAWSS